MHRFFAGSRHSPVFPTGSMTLLTLLCLLTACDSGAQSVVGPDAEVEWHRVLANDTIEGDVVVPAGERWLIGPGVYIAGNLRTDAGTIGMRPGSSLHFLGANPDEYVGGGMGYEPRFARDIGLWVGANGVLDIRGTPKVGWNRTGSDPSWNPDDELWIAPTAMGDFAPRRWYPGDSIPQIDPRVPAAEVLNVTRDILIEGPAHIHIVSQKPQRIEYVTLRNMGVSNAASEGPVLGRYALHLHYGGEGTRGTIIRGVAAIQSQGRVFVPHKSHGITMTDNVSVNSWGAALWWDIGDRTNDIMVDRLAVTGVNAPRSVTGATSQHAAVLLGGGLDMTIRNSAVSGARGSSISNGFEWPSGSDNNGVAIWDFSEGNVAHNSEGAGIRLWFNNPDNHVIANAITYRHGSAGIENGAYRNSHRYINTLSVDDHIKLHSSSRHHRVDDGPARFEGVEAYAATGPALILGQFRLAPELPTEFVDCTLESGPGAPKVRWNVEKAENPANIVFRHCGLTPEDIEIVGTYPATIAGSRIVIEHEDGRRWQMTVDMAAQHTVVTRTN